MFMSCQSKTGCDVIQVNYRRLVIDESAIVVTGASLQTLLAWNSTSYDTNSEIYSISLKQSLNAGDIIAVNLNFSGIIKNDVSGIYWSQYIDRGTSK